MYSYRWFQKTWDYSTWVIWTTFMVLHVAFTSFLKLECLSPPSLVFNGRKECHMGDKIMTTFLYFDELFLQKKQSRKLPECRCRCWTFRELTALPTVWINAWWYSPLFHVHGLWCVKASLDFSSMHLYLSQPLSAVWFISNQLLPTGSPSGSQQQGRPRKPEV